VKKVGSGEPITEQTAEREVAENRHALMMRTATNGNATTSGEVDELSRLKRELRKRLGDEDLTLWC